MCVPDIPIHVFSVSLRSTQLGKLNDVSLQEFFYVLSLVLTIVALLLRCGLEGDGRLLAADVRAVICLLRSVPECQVFNVRCSSIVTLRNTIGRSPPSSRSNVQLIRKRKGSF